MKFTQPKLPYAPDALAPYISAETVDYHYGKHEKAYIDNLNELIKGTRFQDMALEDIICESEGKLFNNASQAWNHIFYFFQFSPAGQKEPSGELRAQIDRQFGSYDEFRKQVNDAGASLFGSGWVWVCADSEGKLVIFQGKDAENPLRQGLKPILVFDVWEHAYYLDYQNRRAEYLDKVWNLVDWDIIEIRYS